MSKNNIIETKKFLEMVEKYRDLLVDEPIIGALGLPKSIDFKSIKGDPSLKETVYIREKNHSILDRNVDNILSSCAFLLKETGCFCIDIGFNNNEIRTYSIFDPFNYEVHEAKNFIDIEYVKKHFTIVPFDEKLEAIDDFRENILSSKMSKYLPPHWRELLMLNETKKYQKEHFDKIVCALKALRNVDEFFLRTASISIPQGTVRTQYNCDGMYYVKIESFLDFVSEMIPKDTPKDGIKTCSLG